MRAAALTCIAATLCTACGGDDAVGVDRSLRSGSLPTMTSRNVATIISDSGIVQYKIVAPVWYVYDEVDTPYWSFPKGLYLEKYDRAFRVQASVACDSARYFKRQLLWKLDGHVEMRNAPSDIFLTQQLFWDQRNHTLRSDSFIHVENKERIIEGFGFHSNERLTTYRVLRPSGIFPVNPQTMTAGPAAPAAPTAPGAASQTRAEAPAATPAH